MGFRILASALFLLPTLSLATTFLPANRPYDVEQYRIQMKVDPSLNPNAFDAVVTIDLKTTAPTSSIVLDAEKLTVSRAELISPTKALIAVKTLPSALEMALPKPLPAGKKISLRIAYRGQIQDAHKGLFKVTDPDDASRGPLLFTHFEPLGARLFFPSNDEPYDKALVELKITTPARYDVISNGRRISDRPVSPKGWHEVVWRMEKPHSTYLVSLAIAPFGKISEGKKPEMAAYVSPKKVESARFLLAATRNANEFFESYLGVKYPWAKYDNIGVPTFVWGGMENTSATHLNEERALLTEPGSPLQRERTIGLTAHELAHQWFGNLVTMKWWSDVWLNESFANYFGTLAETHIWKNEGPEVRTIASTWDSYFRQEDGPRSHPIVDKALSSPDEAFDSINYTKGQNVLRMLSLYIGEDKFKKAVTHYLTQSAYANADYTHLFKAAEVVSGEDLKGFRDSWLLQRGYPIVKYSGAWKTETSEYELKLRQSANHPEDHTLFDFKIPVVFHRVTAPSFHQAALVSMSNLEKVERVKLPARPEWVTVNPGAVVLAKVTPADRDEDLLAIQAQKDPDPISRLWAILELGSVIQKGETPSTFAQKEILTSLRNDPSPHVRIAVLGFLQRTKSRWLSRRLGDGLFEIAQSEYAPGARRVSSTDEWGWKKYQAAVLTSLGRVEDPAVFPFLSRLLARPELPLDELANAAIALAALGDKNSALVLHEALALHSKRGYRYQFALVYAFGAYESPLAAKEIRELVKTAGSDVVGRWGWLISDNQTLKKAPEWAAFLKDFVISDTRHGEEVKSRLLRTVEEVKTPTVKEALIEIQKQSTSERLKEVSRKMLEKNFSTDPTV